MKNQIAALVACLLFGGCAMTLPVKGQSGDGSETFTGTATGYADGAGNLTIASNKGRKCNGDFVYVTNREGSGTFTCSDGSSGPFTFVSTGMRGTGTGTLAGKPFTFSFG